MVFTCIHFGRLYELEVVVAVKLEQKTRCVSESRGEDNVVPATVTYKTRDQSISNCNGISLYPSVAPPPSLHLSLLNFEPTSQSVHLVNIYPATQHFIMPIGKKDARKLKSNKKLDSPKTENSQSLDKQSYAADEQIESGDEDDQDVSEEGMKRLMELVDVDDLNEYEMALLGAEQDEEDEEEGSEEEEVEMSASESVDEDEEMQGEDKVRYS